MNIVEFDKVTSEIQKLIEEISLILMQHENKDFCLAKVHPNSWRQVSYRDNRKEYRFIIVPSPAFERLILQREYPKIVDEFPEYFGTGNDWNIVRAIKEYDKSRLVREYSDREFFDYSVESFKENGWILEDVNYNYPLTDNENDVPTEYEKKFRSMGQPIHYLKAIKG